MGAVFGDVQLVGLAVGIIGILCGKFLLLGAGLGAPGGGGGGGGASKGRAPRGDF